MKFTAALALVASASAFAPAPKGNVGTELNMNIKEAVRNAAFAGAIAVGVATSAPDAANALTKSQINELSYLQVKGTGLANRCPEVKGEDTITPKSGSKLVDMCIEPKAWAVEEEIGRGGKTEKKFVNSKVMTRQTYTLAGVEGVLDTSGGITFKEKEGIDYAATTVQLPGGERVPFLFTVKDLVAKGTGGSFKPGFQMGGDFTVPSYRTGLFLDPKGRGGVTGYDMAVALPGLQSGEEGDDALFAENNKVFDVTKGRIEMVRQAAERGILTRGIFYARVE